jgi:apolipoprotein N-acyltransferase
MLNREMKKIWLVLISVLSGLLLSAAWPARGFPGLLFIGLVPLLFLEDYLSAHRERFSRFSALIYSYPGFLIWNLLTTWWIINSTLAGALMAIFINAFFMSAVFQAFHFSKKVLRSSLSGYVALIVYWISFEYLILNWSLNWPWLNLGNGFAAYYKWVQWYEVTGAFGGTLWVLVANILVYKFIRYPVSGIRHPASGIWYLGSGILWIFLPIAASYLIYNNYHEQSRPVNVIVVQPNLDPYSEQYTIPPPQVLGKIMTLADPLLDSTVSFLVAPESAIQEQMWENDMNTFYSVRMMRQLLQKYPGLNIIVGGSTFYEFGKNEPVSNTARKFTDVDRYYDAYNTAIMVNREDSLQLYHKSKLTPGVESLPSFRGFKWFEKFAINLGGTVGSLGTDSIQRVFHTVHTVPASAVICYESIFGEFFGSFVKNGAQIMFIITNDGWWGNTGGYRQHFTFAALRAIETRRCIGRSANTGLSAFISQRGDPLQETTYWTPAAIKGTLNANSKMTFYTEHGDYLARMAVALTAIIMLVSVGVMVRRRHQGTKAPVLIKHLNKSTNQHLNISTSQHLKSGPQGSR